MKRFSLILSLVFVLSMAVGLSMARADYTGCGHDPDVSITVNVEKSVMTAQGSDIWTVVKTTIPLVGDAWSGTNYVLVPGVSGNPDKFTLTVNFEATNLPSDPANSTTGISCQTIGGVGTYNNAKIQTEKADLVLECDMWAVDPKDGLVHHISESGHLGSGRLKYSLKEKDNSGTASFTFTAGVFGKLFTAKGSLKFVDTPCPP